MVTIIKRGQLPEDTIHQATCVNCKSVLEFKQGEAQWRSDVRETYLIIECPVCKKLVYKSI